MEAVKKLLDTQRQQLDHYFNQVDPAELANVVDLCAGISGLIVFTGVGKSGIIAEKIAMTLISTGTKALYLPPTNFLHGDIGILGDQDLLVLMSRSGETEELMNLVPFARKRNTRLMAVVSNRSSRLGKECDLEVILPMEKELCPFGLAPTTSTAIQLLFGDLLAVALMEQKKFDLGSYAVNHPSGSIGKKATLTVQDVMIQGEQVPLSNPSDRLVDMLVELSNKKCGALLVANTDSELLGIFTDGDLRRSLQSQGPCALEKPMADLMTSTPYTINKDALAWDALKLMQKDPKKFVMVLPVVHENKVVGILRMHDLIQAGLA